MDKKGLYALSQISLLILGIFAMMFIINETYVVDAVLDTGSVSCVDGCPDGYTCIKVTGLCEKTVEKDESGKTIVDTGKKVTNTLLTTVALVEAPKKISSGVSKAANVFKSSEVASDATAASAKTLSGVGTTLKTVWYSAFKGKVLTSAAHAPAQYVISSVAIWAATAAAAGLIAAQIAKAFGASKDQAKTIGYTTAASVFAGLAVLSAGGPAGWVAGGIALIGTLLFYKKESTEIVKYQCLPFKPENGGEHCEECNDGTFPCTEYQCRSLGRACQLINQGTDEELCITTSRGDVTAPEIEPWEDVLPDGYSYNTLNTNFPDERGVRVTNSNNPDGCVNPFEEIRFGITLDEPATCKYTNNRTSSWDDMGSEFLYPVVDTYNHSISMTYPDKGAVEAEGFEYEEGYNEFFVRCEDVNGNHNLANFVFKFCVEESPDMTNPIIKATDPLPESPIKFNQSSVNATFYLNKPSTCRWDHVDKTYDQMENEMSCASAVSDAVPYQYTIAYPCKSELTGIANYVDNDFYVRCKSYPQKNESQRVVMENSFKYILKGTRPLTIEEIGPNETIKDSADLIKVELHAKTSGGANDGEAICYFSSVDKDAKYLSFFETSTYEHTQSLWLGEGAYKYYVKCTDVGGNVAKAETTFTVESDTVSPLIARVYSEDGFLKLITNEPSKCVYSTFGCDYSFDDGVSLSTDDDYSSHFIPWDSSTDLYIKCEDIYKNRPLSENECSIVVRAYEEFVDPNA